MSAPEREWGTPAGVIWHDLECGAYDGDLELWRELAAAADGPILDLGCGTGRVAHHLASRGHELRGLDLDPELAGTFNERAARAGLTARASVGDARDFELEERFGLVMAPMQLLQVLDGREERIALLIAAARHLRPGARIAAAVVDGMPPELVEEAPPPLPDAREQEGWLYSSLPLDAGLAEGTIVVRRLRQSVSPGGAMSETIDETPLRLLTIAELEAEARKAGLEPAGRRAIPPNATHVGSAVAILEEA